jgi:cellulose synthase/poly-beta-1,6-N-acetylglucosamine synthase-like glycosyltransferase
MGASLYAASHVLFMTTVLLAGFFVQIAFLVALPVSVVVAARNEERNLPELFDSLRRQDLDHFEVVLVDDGSSDLTAEIAAATAEADPRFRVVHLGDRGSKGKKNALTAGIAASRHDILVLTDADCRPPPGWLSTVARLHRGDPESGIVAGFSPFLKRQNPLNRFARYENLMTAAHMVTGTGLGKPFVGLGRNLSYRRSLFFRADGFEHSRRSLSGDDDLFVQHIVRRRLGRVRLIAESEGFVPTLGPESLRDWIRQKRRHASAGRFYPPGLKVLLALYHVSSLTLWTGAVLGGLPGVLLLGGRLVALVGSLSPLARRLGQQDLLIVLPVLDLGYMVHTLTVSLAGIIRRPRSW